MSLAIILTGITVDLITISLFGNYKKDWKVIFSVGLYPAFAILWAFIITYYLTGNPMYILMEGSLSLLLLFTIIYILGIIGAYLGRKLSLSSRIKPLIR